MRIDQRSGILGVIVGLVILGGCRNEAAERFRKCEQAEAEGNIEGAWNHCSAAAKKGSSEAQEKLQQIKPKYDAFKAEEQAKEAKAAAERRQAEQAAQAARLVELRKKVNPKSWDDEPDGECQATGLPAFRVTYEGGLFFENEVVALADGCRHLFRAKTEPSVNDNIFCCPGR